MALELAKHNPVYEDIASKFFEAGLVSIITGFRNPTFLKCFNAMDFIQGIFVDAHIFL